MEDAALEGWCSDSKRVYETGLYRRLCVWIRVLKRVWVCLLGFLDGFGDPDEFEMG